MKAPAPAAAAPGGPIAREGDAETWRPICTCHRVGPALRPFVSWTCPRHGNMPK